MRRLPGTADEHVGIRTLVSTFLPAVVVFTVVAGAKTLAGIPVGEFTAEATSVAHLAPYVGAVSALGCFAWAAAVGIFLLGSRLLHAEGDRRGSAFLTCSAALTSYLLADDAFTLHEAVLPTLGVSEWVTYVGIGVAVTTYAVAFRRELLRSAWLFLALAVAMLGASVVVDVGWPLVLGRRGYHVEQYIEDAGKFFGICAWVAYAALSTRSLVRAGFRRSSAGFPVGM